MSRSLFTSESVSQGHPDKVSDQISDGILDALLAQDPKSRVACETLCTTDLVVLAMSDHTANMEAVRRVRDFLPDATLAAVATHVDELHELEAVGVDVARNLYGEAGQGLAGDACDFLADDEGNSDE